MEKIPISEYDYPLTDERIAKYPLKERDHSKLLVYRDGQVSEDIFYHIGDYIPAGSLLVYNNTRVIPARLVFHKTSGARIEIFCLEPGASPQRNGESGFRQEGYIDPYIQALTATNGCTWKCMIGNLKKWKEGQLALPLGETTLYAERHATLGNTYEVQFSWDNDTISFAQILDDLGELPIPPYLNRPTEESDKTTYQTVYSRIKGSVAAPTAGLHFTQAVLDDLQQRGIQTTELTLHVGAGTFQPVKTEDANKHTMHTEIIAVPRQAIDDVLRNLGHIVAVGTTSMRTLESLYFIGEHVNNLHVAQFEPYDHEHHLTTAQALQSILDYLDQTHQNTLHAETQIMIRPGYTFRVVDQLITNFHQPKSTLLLLVSAFVNGDWHTIYNYALSHNFRFLSYGDSSILTAKR